LKTSVRKKVYGTITIISAILGLPGLVIQVYAFFQERAESEADKLRGQISYAKSVVPGCDFIAPHQMRISSVLDRAEKELILNENYSGSKMLYESVERDVIYCTPSLDAAPLLYPPILLQGIALIIAIAFGSLWYRTSKRESQEEASR
jgi:hypothetical protein